MVRLVFENSWLVIGDNTNFGITYQIGNKIHSW